MGRQQPFAQLLARCAALGCTEAAACGFHVLGRLRQRLKAQAGRRPLDRMGFVRQVGRCSGLQRCAQCSETTGFVAEEALQQAAVTGQRDGDADFADLTGIVRGIAEKSAQGRVVSMLEGGYSLTGLASAATAHVGALMA